MNIATVRRPLLLPVLMVLALFIFPGCRAQSSEAPLLDLDTFPKATLDIQSGKQTHRFDIWVADTPRQQQQGLMFVRDLPADRGMIFVPKVPREFSMWMRNTFIPLDMVFIGADGRITRIAENTTPQSLAIISSEGVVSAVLELKGGEAARRGLHPGDRVHWTRNQ